LQIPKMKGPLYILKKSDPSLPSSLIQIIHTAPNEPANLVYF
jgi:hypothetical protein